MKAALVNSFTHGIKFAPAPDRPLRDRPQAEREVSRKLITPRPDGAGD